MSQWPVCLHGYVCEVSVIEPVIKEAPTASAIVRTVGDIRAGSLAVYVFEGVLAEALDHAATNLERELGGFLLGGVFEDREIYVELRGFVPAALTASSATSVTFTHDTWAAMTREAEERFPGAVVLGWMHTHPGLGVFLSAQDLFIHRHFFSQPWQIALVVDPIRRELGFFEWSGEQVVDCGFVCIRS